MRRMFLWAFASLMLVATTANAGLFDRRCGKTYSYSYSYSVVVPTRKVIRQSVYVPLPTYSECIPGVGCPALIPASRPEKGSTSLVPDYPDPLSLVDYKLYDDSGPRLVAMTILY